MQSRNSMRSSPALVKTGSEIKAWRVEGVPASAEEYSC